MIDGAHAIGQVEGIQGDYHTSNLHKWFCAPRGVAYLYVQEGVSEPEGLVTTWGDEYGMHGRFVWQGNLSLRIGTDDYSGYLTIPFLINLFKWFDGIHEGGYKQRNIDLCQYGRDLLTCAWNTKSLVDRVECAMCSILLPEIPGKGRQPSQEEMRRLDKVHLPNFLFDGKRYVRISCHVYNTKEDLQLLRDAVLKLVMDLSEEI